MTARVLVVDDDPAMIAGMSEALRRRGCQVDGAASGVDALAALERQDYRLLVTDLRMPGMDGRELLREARRRRPTLQVVLVTAFATIESAVASVREGAADYLMKPFSPAQLLASVDRCLGEPVAAGEDPTGSFIAVDPLTRRVRDLTRRAARSNATVLLEGESGTGKEVFARFVHEASPRRGGPWVAVNCTALPRDLLEAELFGHTRGAFTGAQHERKGFFRIADGGTLFFDEIGDMQPDLQARLLRVLQDRQVVPLGSETPVPVDVRVVAATNLDLREAVASGRFRQDLFYRLNVVPIRIPPLRERRGDIEPLALHLTRRYAGTQATLSSAARAKLLTHSWPGNIRELENVLQRAAILSGPRIDADAIDLEPDVARPAAAAAPLTLDDAEREVIRRTLIRTRGNRSATAAALGISPRTLRHKLKRYRDLGQPIAEAS